MGVKVRGELQWNLAAPVVRAVCLGCAFAIAATVGVEPGIGQTSPRQPAAPAIHYRFEAGSSTTYRLDYESESHADFRAIFEGKQAETQSSTMVYAVRTKLTGDWIATVIDADAQRVRSVYLLANGSASISINGSDQTSQSNTVLAYLVHGVVVDQRQDGTVTAVYFSQGIDELSREFALSLLADTEFVLPEADKGSVWQTREDDRTGRYSARYQATNSAASLTIRKTRLRYNLEPESTGLQGQTQLEKVVTPTGALEAHFDRALGQLLSLTGNEIQDTVIQGKKVGHAATSIRMERLSEKKLPQTAIVAMRDSARTLEQHGLHMALGTRRSAKEGQDDIQRTELGSETAENLLRKLQTAEEAKDKNDLTPLYLKFKALVYLHPEASAQLGQILSTADVHGPTFSILSGALGAVGNAEAQAALLSALGARSTDLQATANLLPTLAETPNPSAEAEALIWKLASESPDSTIASTAQLAFGSMAHSLEKDSPARARGIVDKLAAQLTDDTPEDRSRSVIGALGNTRSPAALPAIAAYAKNPSPGLRQAAMDALRFMPASGSIQLLIKGLADADPGTRLEAAFSLSFKKMTPESFTAQKNALVSDDSEKVRAMLLRNIWMNRKQFAEAQMLVKNAADHDASEYVRKAASGMLLETQ